MPEFGFGSGAMWSIPSGSNQTPTRLGVIQNCGIDFKSKVVPLYGTNQFPVTTGVGAMAISGTADITQLLARFYNDIFFGTSISSAQTGQTIAVIGEAGTVPGTSTYTIQVTNHSTFVTDLGVIYASTGLPLTRVASLTAVGQYTISAGTYTFYSGDASVAMKMSYTYTGAGGETLTLSNQPMGVASTYKTVLSLPYNSQDFVLTLNACVRESLGMKTELEGFTKQAYTFSAFTDSSDTLGTISFAEVM